MFAPRMKQMSVPDRTTTLSADSPFYVRTGVVLSGQTFFWAYQAVRAGGPGLAVNVTHNAYRSAARDDGGRRAVANCEHPCRGFNSPTTVGTGGVAFDPVVTSTLSSWLSFRACASVR